MPFFFTNNYNKFTVFVRYTPDIIDKLAQLRTNLNDIQIENHEDLGSQQHILPVTNYRQELTKLLESPPLTESIGRVLSYGLTFVTNF